MSTFEHAELIQNINECITPFRKSQPDAMQGFGQLARSANEPLVAHGPLAKS
jgi:hypothetical protein